ncbi:MAG: PAS domain-containing protein [Candidatus Marithrix sp.]|nr:PAS domain-containing protein [Candidatus Marithrix sp.]
MTDKILTADINNLQKQLEAQNAQLKSHVHHLSSLDALVKTINEAQDMDQMMENAMNITLSIFKCDRAWLLYPCDPNVASCQIPIEVTRPEYPGAKKLKINIPMNVDISKLIRKNLLATGPIVFGVNYKNKITPIVAKIFLVQSKITTAIYPKIGKPWLFGIHQCSYAREWTEQEINLFRDFGQHICENLGIYLSHQELQKSESNMRTFMENARGFGIYSAELAEDQPYGSRILFASPSIKEIIGIENPEENYNWFKNIHADDKERVIAAHHTSRTTGKEFDEIFQIYHIYKREWRWIRAISSPVIASDGTFTNFNGLIVDVTDIKLAEEKLQDYTVQLKIAKKKAETANQAKSDFLTNMTHELRTPLNGVLGFAQILQNDSLSITERQHGLDVIKQCGSHLLDLINDVLELTRVGTGRIELYETEFYLPLLLHKLNEIINIRAQEKEINFYVKFAKNLPNLVFGDERRLRQILLNLLDNAVKFTDKGSVTLEVKSEKLIVKNKEHKGEYIDSPQVNLHYSFYSLQFLIQDTGIGIPPEEHEMIFEPFEQVGKQKLETKGTGLGLTISNNFVELMGGKLYISSEFNVGTQFWFAITLKTLTFSPTNDNVKFTKNIQQPIVLPPLIELEKLYELTLMGDIDELEQQTAILSKDMKLKPFVNKIRIFIEKYQVGKLKKWLEGVMKDDG